MAVYTQTVPNVDVPCTWTVVDGKCKNQTEGTGRRDVTVSIPEGEALVAAHLTASTTQVAGATYILTAGGVTLSAGTANQTISLAELITGAGTFTIVFRFKCGGNTAWTGNRCVMTFHDMTLEIVTESTTPPEPEIHLVDAAPENAVILYDAFEKNWTAGLGLAVLTPTECVVSEEAGGKYALKLTHPLTEDGRWRGIEPMAIITAPVPVLTTPVIDAEDNAIVDATFEIYSVNEGGGAWYPTRWTTSYPAWVSGQWYYAGSKVRHGGVNYVARYASGATVWYADAWRSVGTGAPSATRTIPAGTEVVVTDVADGWAHAKLPDGTNGYMKTAQITWLRTDTTYQGDPEAVNARKITMQAFRVTDVAIDSNQGRLTASAMHISYDASAIVLDETAVCKDTPLPEAIVALRAACIPFGADMAPNIYGQFPQAKVSGDWTGKTLSEAVLDPEDGLVALSQAMLVRDNLDFFLLENTAPDRGLRLLWGANLLGVQWTRNYAKIITRVIPVAKAADGKPLYCSPPCVDSPLLSSYPHPFAERMTVSGQVGKEKSSEDSTKWTVDTLREFMQEEAQKRFSEEHADEPEITLTVTFALLGETEGFAQYRNMERLNLYDTVRVTDPTIGLDVALQVKGYEWDAIQRRYRKITLGNVFRHEEGALAGWQIADGSITPRKLSDAARAGLST